MSDPSAVSPAINMIIPCYRQAAYLPAAIESVLAQTAPNVHAIVIDDGSPDDTADVAARFGDRITFIRQANAGVAAARNAGLAVATGDFVVFLDADDLLLPDMVASHLEVMLTAGADVTCSGYRTINSHGEVIHRESPPSFEPDPFHALLPGNLRPPLCYLIRRASIEAIGRFDPDRRKSGHEDWDLLLRLADSGAHFAIVPEELAVYRVHEASASQRFAKMYDSGMAVLSKTRAYHSSCAHCGSRWRQAYQKFYKDYMYVVVHPAFDRGLLHRESRIALPHLIARSIARPALGKTTLLTILRSLKRRLRSMLP